MTEFIAHVSEDKSRFYLLEDHLTSVAELASPLWLRSSTGVCHDLGISSKVFEERIRVDFLQERKGPRLLVVNTVQTAAVVASWMRGKGHDVLYRLRWRPPTAIWS